MAKSKLVHKGQTVQVQTFEQPPRPTNTVHEQGLREGRKAARDNQRLAARMDATRQAQRDLSTAAGVRKAARMNAPKGK